jgi:acetyltransferase-like isoleucine patch superfamily enzyme
MENIFFDINKLKSCGKNVIIGKTVRIRYPELVEIGDNVIIDDFTYISTNLKIHSFVHIAAGSIIMGGRKCFVEMHEFSSMGLHATLVAGADDFMGGIATPLVDVEFKGNVIYGRIILNKHCLVAPGSVVMPNVVFGEGAAVGALSLVKQDLKEWTLYAGIPVKELKKRKKVQIQELEEAFYRKLKDSIE